MSFTQSGRKIVFLIFGPGCSVCESTVSQWKTILKEASTNGPSFVGISVVPDGAMTREFVTRHDLNGLAAIMVSDPACREAYRLGFIPQTVVVDQDGKVEKNWPGMLTASNVREIERYLAGQLASTP